MPEQQKLVRERHSEVLVDGCSLQRLNPPPRSAPRFHAHTSNLGHTRSRRMIEEVKHGLASTTMKLWVAETS